MSPVVKKAVSGRPLSWPAIIAWLVLAALFPPLVRAGFGATKYVVTQSGQQFNPHGLSVKKGEVVEFFNDDGELIHHAYVASPTFSFDSGDQEPGSKNDVVFSTEGDFVVLCGIHPKMRMEVSVH